MKTIQGLRTTIYKVSDIAKAKEWYTKVFQTEPYFDEPFYVGFNIGGYELGLQPEEQLLSKSDNVVSYWGVDDVQTEFNRMSELGAVSHEAPQEVGGGIVVATLKDPWNNVIGLIYNPHFKV
ncbi:VOC family protein [Flavobacterium suncheonense]|uniref:Bleomycin resistance protein n=1 Tax=Flavobacterium suncheonense GH29-5 = DSM 17707 TaxID=1121899 RepID=A0A0A2MNX2_9FLAO|nr:glyoxalase/bleomycin resistance/extradiol dioxygenase family protein [Flavobacterium suncheonense]KGO89990.1 bleomycin resistance protein [Flavobacterium suncheonense GH29-5 = DSM 17707]